MIRKKCDTPELYLENFRSLLKLNEYPKIKEYFKYLETQFIKICSTKYQNILDQMADLLEIEAQLQLLFEFFKDDFYRDSGLNEEEIISIVKKDKDYYYRELSGIRLNKKAPYGLIYLSEK